MDAVMDALNLAFPAIHTVIFIIGVYNNVALLLASFLRTPRTLNTYSIMIKLGTLNDLMSVFCDFFTMQRMLVIPGNLLYLSLGPCSLISPRSCYLTFCIQLTTLIYSLYVMTASFAYRLWILHRSSPTRNGVLLFMAALYVLPVLVGGSFTFAQADDSIVREFLAANAPSHSGMTPHLVFTILFIILTPGPAYAIIMVIRHKILSKLCAHSTEMSERTRKMHGNLVQALTVHAMLPPISMFCVVIYLVLFFDIYRHIALEKAIYTFAAIPPAVGAFCTIYYVEPYKRQIVKLFMNTVMDLLNSAFPIIHTTIFIFGVTNNVSLLVASFLKTPRALSNYSIMIKAGTFNDLISVFSDFFTMQRLLVMPGNLVYLSLGPCSLVSPRACYLVYCMQLCTLIYSLYVMTASFAYRLYILNYSSPSARSVLLVMAALYIPPALVSIAFTFAQADIEVVQEFLMNNAPSYLTEPGAMTGIFFPGHSGMTPHLILTIVFIVFTPGPVYVIIMVLRHKIISKLVQHSTDMSERTRKMHSNLVQALTVHAMLPPITCIGVVFYLTLFFDIYHHIALEKAIFVVVAIPPAVGAFCTTYYVEPYRRFVFCQSTRELKSFTPSTVSISGVHSAPATLMRTRARTF